MLKKYSGPIFFILALLIVIPFAYLGQKHKIVKHPTVANEGQALGSKTKGDLQNNMFSATQKSDNAPAIAIQASPESLQKLQTLEEILASKNDNDSRLDTDFQNLPADAKQLFYQKYHLLKPEDRNGRGTIVFLLGQNLTDPSDFQFLKEVVTETPCLSLADCSAAAAKNSMPEAEHLESADPVTLNYPQMVALQSIDNDINRKQGLDPQRRQSDLEVLQTAAKSPSAMVAQKARQLLEALENTP